MLCGLVALWNVKKKKIKIESSLKYDNSQGWSWDFEFMDNVQRGYVPFGVHILLTFLSLN